jgi:outer membrane protein assembly factor BamB
MRLMEHRVIADFKRGNNPEDRFVRRKEMSMSRLLAVLLSGILLLAVSPSVEAGSEAEAHWPRWRGPESTGVAPDAHPPVEFGEDLNLDWKLAVPGEGSSTPVIWGDRLFMLAAEPSGAAHPPGSFNFNVVCVDRTTGEIDWLKTARTEVPHEGHHKDHGYASHSPVTDGERLYVHYGSRGIHCFDLEGNRIWERDLGKMETRRGFGEGSSPALYNGKLFVNWDHQGDSFIVALDAATGETIWKRDRDEVTSWSTPLVIEHEGLPQVVVSATRRVRAYHPDTGDIIWETGGQTVNVIPTPVSDFGMLFATSGFMGKSLMAIELGHTGDLTGGPAIKWSVSRATPYVPSPLLYDDQLYVIDTNRAILSCYDAKTGKPNYVQQRLPELTDVYASPVGADGRVYIAGRDGGVLVIRNSPEFEVLAQNRLNEGIDASPVAIGKTLYLRGKKHLYSFTAP